MEVARYLLKRKTKIATTRKMSTSLRRRARRMNIKTGVIFARKPAASFVVTAALRWHILHALA